MKRMFLVLLAAVAITGCAGSLPPQEAQGEVSAALREWVSAVKSRSVNRVLEQYDERAVMLATFEQKPLLTQNDRRRYFKDLLSRDKLNLTVDKEYVRVIDHKTAAVSGLYTYSYLKGKRAIRLPARYTFVFERQPEAGWQIVEHHSSQMPFKK